MVVRWLNGISPMSLRKLNWGCDASGGWKENILHFRVVFKTNVDRLWVRVTRRVFRSITVIIMRSMRLVTLAYDALMKWVV